MLTLMKQLIFVGLLLMNTAVLATREVTDELGRHVAASDQPRRIVCLAPSITETVYALGLGDAVVAVTDYTTFPPEARNKRSVSGLVDPSMEKIVSLHPDLVLATWEINRRETVEQLERYAIPVFIVHPQGLQGILASIQHIREALNRSGQARELVNRLEAKWKAIATRVQGLRRPKVFVVIWHEPVITVGDKAFITEVISAGGGESATADMPQAWPQISLEEVVRRAPDFLLLFRGSHGAMTLEELQRREGWSRLEAVRRSRAIYMDERMEHPSPVIFDALEDLATKLHPEGSRAR